MKRLFKTIALAAIASLALTGCFKHDPIDRHGGYEPGGNGRDEVEKLVVNERSDWHVSYVAREDWVNDDGSVDRVEHFKFNYTGKGYYIVRLVRPEDFEGVYERFRDTSRRLRTTHFCRWKAARQVSPVKP